MHLVLLRRLTDGVLIERVNGGMEMCLRQVQVHGGVFEPLMSHQQLDRAQVGTRFQQVRGEAVPQRMRTRPMLRKRPEREPFLARIRLKGAAPESTASGSDEGIPTRDRVEPLKTDPSAGGGHSVHAGRTLTMSEPERLDAAPHWLFRSASTPRNMNREESKRSLWKVSSRTETRRKRPSDRQNE